MLGLQELSKASTETVANLFNKALSRKTEASSRQGLPGSRTQGRATALAIHGFWFPAIPAGTTVTISANNAL